MENKLDLSVVLAVFNEEGSLRQEMNILKQALDGSALSYEIIIVNDASTDGTVAILKDYEGLKGITILHHPVQRGSGGARKTGTLMAKGEYVAWTDVDLTYPNERVGEFCTFLKKNNYAQVIGARDSEKGSYWLIRIFAKWFIRRLAIFLSGQHIPDLNSGFRVFRRDIALKYIHLIPDGFSCVSSLSLAFLCGGHPVSYIPIRYSKRTGNSKFHPISDTYSYLLQVTRMITYFNPLKVFLSLGFLLFFLGFAFAFLHIGLYGRLKPSDVLLIQTAVVVSCLGLLADLIVAQGKK